MERSEYFDLVTAYVDNELNNENQVKKIKSLIDSDEDIRYEYQVQSFLKTYVKNKVQFVDTPESLKERIGQVLFNELKPEPKRESFIETLLGFLRRPAYAFGLAVVVIAAFLVIFLSESSLDKMAASQRGETNMFVEAKSNFSKILSGSLNLQYQSSNPLAIKEYFKEQGVSYNTVIPRLKDSKIIGAVVSDRNGEKFAHHVYRTNTGKLVYLYQADEKCIKRKKNLNLSDDLVKFIDEGKLYKYEKDGQSFLIWKNQGNICVLVSNENMESLENQLLSSRN